MSLSQVQLDKIRVGLTVVASEYLQDADVEVIENFLTRSVDAKLQGFIIQQNLSRTKTFEFKYPTTWWDAFVLRYEKRFPKWYLRKWPVCYTKVTHTVDCSAVYPDLAMPSGQAFTNKLYVAKDSTNYARSLPRFFPRDYDATLTVDDNDYRAVPEMLTPCLHKQDLRLFRPNDVHSNFYWGSTENWVCSRCGANYRDVIR